ncbi:hypothetical protein IQ260_12860 [Leptolyngbya cf. ectocarpi LEGE 11479]|uniref:Uncharacterized protein n=1 Tax=Leptolyngbya cf. ectocarpi LEGE 11479 TaxID=1828722 RepID=A0A929F5E8_LEPEC|nr:hypothetical protein [Leptolyngbya ectocarpi]MBE9067550.1 hypothetical protein [Leptolyngbya cf. ectocarpi LEGE 11479]
MKIWHWGWIGLMLMASACSQDQVENNLTQPAEPESATAEVVAEADDSEASCDPMDDQAPLQPTAETELPFERFDFRPTEVTATDTTLTFAGKRYQFTFCKRDRTWGIETLEAVPETEEDYAEYFEALGDPDYETITREERPYQARVRLDASWLASRSNPNDDDLEEVIFELIKPGEIVPISTVLYTNTDILDRELGASAGVPTLTRALATDEDIWWSVGFEQGEGASGIATVVQYQIATDKIVVWQPTELDNTQITDLAVTGTDDDRTLWLGTQYSGEGNPYLPAKGLVAYRPADETVQTYTVENSPLIGSIPTRLWAENETLWIATASGACEIEWATIADSDSWDCWQFTPMAKIPDNPTLYPSLLAETPIKQIPDISEPVELLWLADMDITTPESATRYEIAYAPGLTTQLDQGADYYVGPEDNPEDGYFWWPGQDWSWTGERFVRYWDQVAVNYVGGGPQGIGPSGGGNYVADWRTMRGEFELLDLTADTVGINYYSAWIDAADIVEPWVTVTPVTNAPLDAENPTDTVLTELKQAAKE